MPKERTMAEKTEGVDHAEEARRLAAKANRPENDNGLAVGLASIAQVHASLAIAEQLERLNEILARPDAMPDNTNEVRVTLEYDALVRFLRHEDTLADRAALKAALAHQHQEGTGVGEDEAKARAELAKLKGEIRYHEHHERKAEEQLDLAGVEKFDSEDRDDSTDDSAGQPWAIWVRIKFLRRRAERAEKRVAELEAATPEPQQEEQTYTREQLLSDELIRSLTQGIVEGSDGEVISLAYETVADALGSAIGDKGEGRQRIAVEQLLTPVVRAEPEGERITFELECGHVVGLALADAGGPDNLPTALLCPVCEQGGEVAE